MFAIGGIHTKQRKVDVFALGGIHKERKVDVLAFDRIHMKGKIMLRIANQVMAPIAIL